MANNGFRLENNANKVKRNMTSRKRTVLLAMGEKGKSLWTKYITDEGLVVTNRFRGGVSSALMGESKVAVGNNVKYSVFLELGTSKMAARPTLKPAILEHKEDFRKIAENLLKRG